MKTLSCLVMSLLLLPALSEAKGLRGVKAAQPKPAKSASRSPASARPKDLSSKVWRAQLQKSLPAELCEPNDYFKTCYMIQTGDCQKAVTKGLDSCLRNTRTPAYFSSKDQSKEYAYGVGRCVGKQFASSQKSKLNKRNPKCK